MGNSLDFVCLEATRTARAAFFDEIIEHAQRHQAQLAQQGKKTAELAVTMLRSENTYQVAEFYYLIDEFGLNTPAKIEAFIERHNQDMQDLLADTRRLGIYGIRQERIAAAIFSEEEKNKVVENAVGGRIRLDQSDIGRCLAALISPETCRKVVIALGDGGFFERKKTGAVRVTSTGILEDCFRRHLREISKAIFANAPLRQG